MPPLGACTVYCGSSWGARPAHGEAARTFGRLLAERQLELIYGGGNVGLMGAVADAALEAGGRVVGVIPQFLKDLEREHKGCTELQVVPDMRTRKLQMLERGDAFVALPGGVGTLEELLEVLEWTVSGRHDKPLGLLNLDGLYDPLLELLRGAVQERFEAPDLLDRLVVASCPEELLAGLEAAAAAAGACREKLAAPRAPAAAALPLASQPELEGASATAVLADNQEPAGGGGAEDFRAAAEHLGRLLAEEGAAVALGGSAACPGSLAHAVAAGAAAAGGRVQGVAERAAPGVPAERGNGAEHPRHARKRELLERSARVAAVPGGVAVMEELLEVVSGATLARHERPVGVLNTGGFYDPLLRLLEGIVSYGFAQKEFLTYLVHAPTPEGLVAALRTYAPTRVRKKADTLPAPAAKRPCLQPEGDGAQGDQHRGERTPAAS